MIAFLTRAFLSVRVGQAILVRITVFVQMSIHQLLPELLDTFYSLQAALHVNQVLDVRRGAGGTVVVLLLGGEVPRQGPGAGVFGPVGQSRAGREQGLPVELTERHPLEHGGEHHVRVLEKRKIGSRSGRLSSEQSLEMISEGGLEERRGREFVVEGREVVRPVRSEVSWLVQWRQSGGLAVSGEEGRGSGVTEPPVLGERRHGAEGLPTLVALDLHPAVGVHPLVAAEVGELSVGFVADLAPERFD